MNLKGKSFLKLLDLTSEEIVGLLDLAADLKAKKKAFFSLDIRSFFKIFIKNLKEIN